MIALPSEVLEPMLVESVNLALRRFVEEPVPTDEAVERLINRVEGIHYITVCNSCNQRSDSHNGIHASIAMSNTLRMIEHLRRETMEDRIKLVEQMRRI